MNAFIVELPNRPGEMARVTEVLAARNVNILVWGIGIGDRYGMPFVCNDEEGARKALGDAGISYRELPILHVRMEDKPGQSAAASRKLADAGVNIELWAPVDTGPEGLTVAVGVDDLEAAETALSGQLTTWSYH